MSGQPDALTDDPVNRGTQMSCRTVSVAGSSTLLDSEVQDLSGGSRRDTPRKHGHPVTLHRHVRPSRPYPGTRRKENDTLVSVTHRRDIASRGRPLYRMDAEEEPQYTLRLSSPYHPSSPRKSLLVPNLLDTQGISYPHPVVRRDPESSLRSRPLTGTGVLLVYRSGEHCLSLSTPFRGSSCLD